MKHEILDAWVLGGLMIAASSGSSIEHLCAGLLIAVVASICALRK